ncbi:hypothetical protein HDE_13103 [Halotydeus destructor]|nr:hypothetical protein HDE_13103 [Halotydeus destructor]
MAALKTIVALLALTIEGTYGQPRKLPDIDLTVSPMTVVAPLLLVLLLVLIPILFPGLMEALGLGPMPDDELADNPLDDPALNEQLQAAGFLQNDVLQNLNGPRIRRSHGPYRKPGQ